MSFREGCVDKGQKVARAVFSQGWQLISRDSLFAGEEAIECLLVPPVLDEVFV